MHIAGVEFAPLNIPLQRRLQTLLVLWHTLAFFVLGCGSAFVLFCMAFTPLFFITWLYVGWYFYDANQSSVGGRKVDWIRRLPMWNYFRDYFPVRLIKTADLDPVYNYLIGSHPHGVVGFGPFCNFLTEATGFSKMFPGIDVQVFASKNIFRLPVQREYMMAMGCVNVSEESIKYTFGQKEKGTAGVIVIGGAKEVFWAKAGETTKLILKNRKGFIKMAIQTGAKLVPAFTFGENELYRLPIAAKEGSWFFNLQQTIQHKLGFAPVLFFGRGIFNYTFGLLPFRKPVTTVVGKPIYVFQNDYPTDADIDDLHNEYMNDLKTLFDDYKVQCGHAGEELEFI